MIFFLISDEWSPPAISCCVLFFLSCTFSEILSQSFKHVMLIETFFLRKAFHRTVSVMRNHTVFNFLCHLDWDKGAQIFGQFLL